MPGNDQLPGLEFQQFLKSPNHSFIGGHTSLKGYWLYESPPLTQIAYIVSGQGIAKPSYYFFL